MLLVVLVCADEEWDEEKEETQEASLLIESANQAFRRKEYELAKGGFKAVRGAGGVKDVRAEGGGAGVGGWAAVLRSSLLCGCQALRAARRAEDKLEFAKALNNLGLVYYHMQKPRTAARRYEEAILLLRDMGSMAALVAAQKGLLAACRRIDDQESLTRGVAVAEERLEVC